MADLALSEDEDYDLRCSATHALSVIGDGPSQLRLLTLAEGKSRSDRDAELKGANIFRIVVTWHKKQPFSLTVLESGSTGVVIVTRPGCPSGDRSHERQ